MKRTTVLLVVLGVVLSVAGYRALVEPRPGRLRTVPDAYRGVWVTSNPSYGDRYLEIGADYITFGTGGVNSKRFAVLGFDPSADPEERDRGTVFFRDVDGSRYSRDLTVSPGGRRQLVFSHQPEVVWVPE